MSTLNAQIKEAINTFDIPRARELLRDALKEADAETYFLASKVAVDDEQKKDFLQKAVELDMFHEQARIALKNLTAPASQPAAPQTAPPAPVSAQYTPPSNTQNFAPVSQTITIKGETYQLADLGSRFIAYLIDNVGLAAGFILPVLWLYFIDGGESSTYEARPLIIFNSVCIGVILLVGAFILLPTQNIQAGRITGVALMVCIIALIITLLVDILSFAAMLLIVGVVGVLLVLGVPVLLPTKNAQTVRITIIMLLIPIVVVSFLFEMFIESSLVSVIGIYIAVHVVAVVLIFKQFNPRAWLTGKPYSGQTIGKKLMGIKAVAISDEFTLRRSIVRFICWILGTSFIVGLIFPWFDKQRRGLHDIAAETLVVKASPIEQ